MLFVLIEHYHYLFTKIYSHYIFESRIDDLYKINTL